MKIICKNFEQNLNKNNLTFSNGTVQMKSNVTRSCGHVEIQHCNGKQVGIYQPCTFSDPMIEQKQQK